MFKDALATAASFTAGNFAYQALVNQNWNDAVERSFFQAVAILTFAYFTTLKN